MTTTTTAAAAAADDDDYDYDHEDGAVDVLKQVVAPVDGRVHRTRKSCCVLHLCA